MVLLRGLMVMLLVSVYLEGVMGEYICENTFFRIQNALYAEIMSVILAIKHTRSFGFTKLWLENDSTLLCQAFSSANVVPWILKGKRRRCMQMCLQGI